MHQDANKSSAKNLTETKILCYIFGMSKRLIKIFIFSMIFLLLGFQVFALNQKDETKNSLQAQKKTTVKDSLKIDFRFNTKFQDKKNYLKWKTSSKKVKDSYDAVSGASVSHSTGELLTLFRDGNSKNLLAPKGLRSLLLFAVSNPECLESDNFTAEKGDNGKIKISFTHRKIGYFIQTDEKGKLDLENGFFIKKPQEEKQNTDSEENTNDDEFYSDEPEANPAPEKKFEGKLSVNLSGGILKISGKLNLVEYQEVTSKETSEENFKEIFEATSEKI